MKIMAELIIKKKWRSFINRFTIVDLVTMAMCASLGIATKPLIIPLAQFIASPFLIPKGAVAGGFYMLWLILGRGIVDKRGAATLTALVQAILVLGMGSFGSHGIISLVTYLLPGIAIDLVLLVCGHRVCCWGCALAAGIAANVTGALLSSLIFFHLPLLPLLITLGVGALSGGIGGIIAYQILCQVRKFNFQ